MCGMSGILACHLTGLYLVLIVTLLVSMGIFRAPQAGQGVWKGHRHCQVSGSACAPGPPGRLSLALGHTLIQGNSCENGGRGGLYVRLKLWGLLFPKPLPSRLAKASSHQCGLDWDRNTKV